MAGAGDAEHRELNLDERVRALESAIEFDSLPLRKLKDWLEQDLVIDPKTNVEGGADGLVGADGADGPAGADGADGTDGTDGTDGADGDPGTASPMGSTYFDRPGLVVPVGFPYDYSTFNCADQLLTATRFVCPEDITVGQIGVVITGHTAGTAEPKLALGLHNDIGDTLHGRTALADITAYATKYPSYWDIGEGGFSGNEGYIVAYFDLTSDTDLTKGVVYTLSSFTLFPGTGTLALGGASQGLPWPRQQGATDASHATDDWNVVGKSPAGQHTNFTDLPDNIVSGTTIACGPCAGNYTIGYTQVGPSILGFLVPA